MLEELKRFEEKRPEIVFEWKDQETEAEGWIVINSLRGGAAGGGTRMRKGLDKHEVTSLAKTMEMKFTVAGPHIGGAKSGINFEPFRSTKKGFWSGGSKRLSLFSSNIMAPVATLMLMKFMMLSKLRPLRAASPSGRGCKRSPWRR